MLLKQLCPFSSTVEEAVLPLLSSRNDTVRYALDVLAILTVVPKIQLQLAEPVDVLDEAGSTVSTVGKLHDLHIYQLSSATWVLAGCSSPTVRQGLK